MEVVATRALYEPAGPEITAAFQKLVPRIEAAADRFTVGRADDTRTLVVVLHCLCGQCDHGYNCASMNIEDAVFVSPMKDLDKADPRIHAITLYPPFKGSAGVENVAETDEAFIAAFVELMETACAPALADA